MDLYDSAIQESSRKQYGTGQRAYLRFTAGIPTPGCLLPFPQRQLQRTELMLAFFMASLILKPSITRPSTILAYETHVKWSYKKEGCHPYVYNTPFLKQVRKGLRKTLPSPKDARSAFTLPKYLTTPVFKYSSTAVSCFLRFATIIGFIGMLRPHTTFAQLVPSSFTLMVRDSYFPAVARTIKATESGRLSYALNLNQHRFKVVGFYIDFKAKTQREARAYFPNLSDPRVQRALTMLGP